MKVGNLSALVDEVMPALLCEDEMRKVAAQWGQLCLFACRIRVGET